MTPKPSQPPQQLSLWSRELVDVSWLMQRWKKSRPTILSMLESGELAAMRFRPRSPWKIEKADVLDYESRLAEQLDSVKRAREFTPITGKKGQK